MIVPSMTNKEKVREILNDHKIICKSSTIQRMMNEYHRERIKTKVKKEDEYLRYHEFKSKSKNKWIISLSKICLSEKYHTANDCVYTLFSYYITDHDFFVFLVSKDGFVSVYNTHFFKRYRERMNLNIVHLLDVAKYYFHNNNSSSPKYMDEKDGYMDFVSKVKDGFELGQFIVADSLVVKKTFIGNATANSASMSHGKESIKMLKEKLLKENNYEEYIQLRMMCKNLSESDA